MLPWSILNNLWPWPIHEPAGEIWIDAILSIWIAHRVHHGGKWVDPWNSVWLDDSKCKKIKSIWSAYLECWNRWSLSQKHSRLKRWWPRSKNLSSQIPSGPEKSTCCSLIIDTWVCRHVLFTSKLFKTKSTEFVWFNGYMCSVFLMSWCCSIEFKTFQLKSTLALMILHLKIKDYNFVQGWQLQHVFYHP